MLGNSPIGRPISDSVPMSSRNNEMTIAKTGRSMKKRDMRDCSVRRGGRGSGFRVRRSGAIEILERHGNDFQWRAGPRFLQSLHHDASAGFDPGIDHLPVAEARTQCDRPQLGLLVRADYGEEVLAELLLHG